MKKQWENQIKTAFSAPEPEKKNVFLRQIQEPPISNFEFALSQAAYIRKWIWVVSALLFGAAWIGSSWLKRDMLWCISACMPLLALAVLTESGRSIFYGMAELELSARFSLKSVVLARLGILGTANLVLLALLLPLVNRGGDLLRTGVYMLCPYLLTAYIGLWAVRRVRGKEAMYICAGIAAAVSMGNLLLHRAIPLAYGERGFGWWTAALVLLIWGTAKQCSQMIKQTEELAWNL